MKRSIRTRAISVLLVVMMVLSLFSMTAMAEESNNSGVIYENGKFGYNGYYNVISRKDYVLVPGAAYEYEMVLNNDAGNRRQVLHVIEADPSNPDISIVPGYYQIDKDLEDPANWSHKELTDMAKYYEDQLGYNIVGGMNTDLYYTSYSPRVLVYNGKSIGNFGENVANDGGVLNATSSILYVFRDAEGNISCDVKAFNKTELETYLKEGILLHAVGVSFGMVVKDGKLVKTTELRESSGDAARSMVGVKADGTLVICMNDGRGANNSEGLSGEFEEGEVMLALGCQWAANCDGGGSSTFLTKRAGEESFTMRSVPCDGSQRPTAHGIFVASNVGPTGELDVINISSDYDYFAPNTVYTFDADAIDTHGYAMAMPADIQWALSDASFGTVQNGTFTSNGTKGEVDVQVISGGKVVGTKTIIVDDPEVFELSADSTVLPYSTEEKLRTITLPIVAMTGENNVYIDTNAVSVTLSDEKGGILDGFRFTAVSDTAVAGVDVTVTYGNSSLVYAITYGKGSEIIYDFENGGKSGFMGFTEAKQWSLDNGVNNTLVGSNPLGGQFNAYLSSDTFVSTAANGGQVRNGSYALGWKLDNTDAAFGSWSYNVLFNTGEEIVLRDEANGKLATTLGMWLYIPEEAFQTGKNGVAFQSQLYVKRVTVDQETGEEKAAYYCQQDHFMFTSAATGKKTNLNSATNADIPESRWVYATIDISKYDYLCTPGAFDEGNSRSPSFIRTYVQPTIPANITFYIDDITLDYSSAVDDRILPVITTPMYSSADTAVSLENDAVISGEKFAFSAAVWDNAALDASSGKILVDGAEVRSAVSGGMLSTAEDVALIPGTHTVSYEIKDELGNPMKITRTFTVAGEPVIALSGHNTSGQKPMAQSVYYVDIKASELENIDNLTAVLKLNNANTWETDGAVVAAGFEASLRYNEISELLTVTVKRMADSRARSVDQTLISIPVRVWTFDRFNYVTNTPVAAADMGNRPVVDVECEVVSGVVDGKSFGGVIDVATELATTSSPYHVHDAELTVLNKEATVTESGYENRTFCETCQSVVDWGTILAAKGHSYAIVDGKFVCQDEGCGKVLETGTGVFTLNGDYYYSVNGILKTGWQDMGTYEGSDYINGGSPFTMYGYAGKDYKMYANGEYTVDGITYTFDENAITMGAWTTNSKGTRYSVGPAFIKRSWVTLAGDQYYFGEDNYMYAGTRSIPKNRNNLDEGVFWYEFGEDGKYIREYTDLNGIVEENGAKYWVINGQNAYGGILYIDGYYYYARSHGQLVQNATYWTTKTNDLMAAGNYSFDEEGRMIDPPADAVVPHDHAYEADVTEPTCTDAGFTTYTCTCGDSYVADEVSALNHDFSVFVETVAPTAEAQGYTTYKCSRCDATENRDFVDYEEPEIEVPTGTIEHKGNTLSLDGIVFINQYTTIDGFGGQEYIEANGGLLIWKTPVTEDEATFENAQTVQEGLTYDTKNKAYVQTTEGIASKMFANELYLRTYVKDAAGNYHYGPIKEYSVQAYCEGRLAKSNDPKMKAVASQMLHYGAAAQTYFKYNLSDLANANIAEQYPSDVWNPDLLDAVVELAAPDYAVEAKTYGKTLSLDGTVLINYYYDVADGFDYEIASGKLQIWDGVSELTEDNVSYEVDLAYTLYNGKTPLWTAACEGFIAKAYSKTIYARGVLVDTVGNEHCSDIVAYHPEAYAAGRIANSKEPPMVELAKQLVMYGERARLYLG